MPVAATSATSVSQQASEDCITGRLRVAVHVFQPGRLQLRQAQMLYTLQLLCYTLCLIRYA